MANKRRPLSLYAEHAGISIEAARQRLLRLEIDYLEDFDFHEADRRFHETRDLSRPTKSVLTIDESEDVDPQTRKDPKYIESQARRECARANMAELEYRRQIRELIPAVDVDKEWSRISRIVRDNLKNIARRLSAQLAAESDAFKCEQMIEEEIDHVLEAMNEQVMNLERVA